MQTFQEWKSNARKSIYYDEKRFQMAKWVGTMPLFFSLSLSTYKLASKYSTYKARLVFWKWIYWLNGTFSPLSLSFFLTLSLSPLSVVWKMATMHLLHRDYFLMEIYITLKLNSIHNTEQFKWRCQNYSIEFIFLSMRNILLMKSH